MRNPVRISGMGYLVKWRPIGTAFVKGIENDIAAFGVIIMRNKFTTGVINQCGIAALFNPVEHLAQYRGLTATGGPDHGEVPGFASIRHRHFANVE